MCATPVCDCAVVVVSVCSAGHVHGVALVLLIPLASTANTRHPVAVSLWLRRQNVFPSFLRALKDPFARVRVAAIKSVAHTCELIPPPLLAAQVLPAICPLLVDPFDECRAAAISCIEKSCAQLRKVRRGGARGATVAVSLIGCAWAVAWHR